MKMREHMQADSSISPELIRAQVARILASEAFVRCRRMQRFLEFIVEESLAGRAGQLGEYCIGTAVFDRGEDFEPALDPIVRNDARRLRLKLLEYYRVSPAESNDSVLIDIPKGGYAPVFLRPSIREDKSASPERLRRLAVLPFEVLSPAPEHAMHSRSLCMSLTAGLTNVQGLEAVAHSYFREQPVREAASELRLSYAIHGSVVHSSDQCRIIVNLIHVSDGTQLWAREYDFSAMDMLSVQSEIVGNVLSAVRSRLLIERPPLKSLAIAA